jgi:hypothetical protein
MLNVSRRSYFSLHQLRQNCFLHVQSVFRLIGIILRVSFESPSHPRDPITVASGEASASDEASVLE